MAFLRGCGSHAPAAHMRSAGAAGAAGATGAAAGTGTAVVAALSADTVLVVDAGDDGSVSTSAVAPARVGVNDKCTGVGAVPGTQCVSRVQER